MEIISPFSSLFTKVRAPSKRKVRSHIRYSTNPLNFDVFVTGMQRWTNPALKALLALEPEGPDADRARTILAFYGPPQNWDDACWGAV